MFFKGKNQNQKNKNFIDQVVESVGFLIIIFLIRTIVFGLYQVPSGSMETTMLVGESFVADKLSYWIRDPRRGEIVAFNDPLFEYSSNNLVHLFQQYVWGPSNWTKRVIGVPGDIVEGRVENGVPYVYVNGERLDEPYVNTYPLAHVWTEDPARFKERVRQELASVARGMDLQDNMINDIVLRKWISRTTLRSYDPSKSLHDQPFYRMHDERMILNADGSYHLLNPKKAISTHHRNMLADQPMNERGQVWNSSDEFYVELGPDEYWFEGDNRQGSHDCRYFGPVKRRYIHGRIVFRLFSVDTYDSWILLDFVKRPIDIMTRIRWSRFFQFIV